MKLHLDIFTIILTSYLITFTLEDICPEEKMSITPLGKCHNIEDFLLNENLSIKTENLLYLASNNEGKIEKNNYMLEIYKLNDTKLQSHNMKKSKLYIPESCLEQMEENDEIKLDTKKGIVIVISDSNNMNRNNISDKYFIIRHNSEGTTKPYINSKTYDLSFCSKDPILFEDEVNIEDLTYNDTEGTPIDIDTILYGRKLGIDLFDPYSDFLNDICFKFSSQKGTDVPLDSRLEDYYQNITFCDDYENSHYLAYNYSSEKKTFIYRCAYGFYSDAEDKSGYLDIIDKELKSLVSVSNIKVITCYKKFLNIRGIIGNYGGMICIFVLIIQFVCFLIFCFSGVRPIEEKLNDLFVLGTSILRRLSTLVMRNNTEGNNLLDGKGTPGKKFNLWGTIRKIIQKKKEERLKQEKEKQAQGQDILQINENNARNNPPKKRHSLKRKSIDVDEINIEFPKIEDVDEAKDINHDNINNNEDKPKKERKDKKKKSTRISKDNNINNNKKVIHMNETGIEETGLTRGNTPDIKDSKVAINDKEPKDEKTPEGVADAEKKSNKSQIYDYESDELNELPFKRALKYDNRGFCKYYWNILMFSHIILNVFFRHNDYNLFSVKLGLLFMTFPINLTFNIFFYTNKSMKLSYIRSMDDISNFWSNIANTVYSSLLSTTLLIILKFICLTHNSVRVLRKIKDVNKARKKSVCVLRCIKIRVTIYYLLSFAFVGCFGFYVLCFCAVFENTQKELVKSTLTSWLISLLYPFGICLVTSIVRKLAFKCRSRVLYTIKLLLQFL